MICLILDVEAQFDQEYNLDEYLLTMRALDGKNVPTSHQGFDVGFLEEKNLDLWPIEEYHEGSSGTEKSFLGFDVEKNEFSGEVQLKCTM